MNQKKKIFLVQVLILIGSACILWLWKSNLTKFDMKYTEIVSSVIYEQQEKTKIINISSVDDWYELSKNSDFSYKDYLIQLNADLDFTGYEELNPIGNSNCPFEGEFRGNGYVLKNMIMTSDEECVGVFGYIKDACIDGMNLENCQISSNTGKRTGGLVGYSNNGIIKNCSFSGIVMAKEGSAGAIVGENWGYVSDCVVNGEVYGSGQNAYYGLEDMWIAYGTGGIAGVNGTDIFHCKNEAIVRTSKNSATDYVGGISGNNYGWIEACTNSGDISGGGIVETNYECALIRGCFNFGQALAGIAVNSYSEIEYCVNLGILDGRYAGDIVSSGGQGTDDLYWGSIRYCFYINSSHAGVLRHNNYDDHIIEKNYKIQQLSSSQKNTMMDFLDNNDYQKAYEYVLKSHEEWRTKVFLYVVIVFAVIITLVDLFWIIKEQKKLNQVYKNAVTYKQQGKFKAAMDLFSQLPSYKDGNEQADWCYEKYINQCVKKEKIEFGMSDGCPIPWIIVRKSDQEITLVAEKTLITEPIHAEDKGIVWEESELYAELNLKYKENWFSDTEKKYIASPVSLLKIGEVQEFFSNSKIRKCKSIKEKENVLSINGYVYWWLLWDDNRISNKMPFVTSEGLISEIGKKVTAEGIAVRPVLKIRIKNEKSN